MQKTGDPFGVVCGAGMSIWLVASFCYDLKHPELWHDIYHNPIFNAIVLAAGAVFVLCVWLRTRRRINARLDRGHAMLKVVERLKASGYRIKAEEALRLFRRAMTTSSTREYKRLAKQFFERFDS